MPAQRPVQGTRSTQGGAPRRAPQKKKRNLAARIGIGILKFIAVCMCLAIILGSVAAVLLSMYIVKATADDATLINLDDLELAYTSIVYYKNTNADGQEEWLEYQRLDSPEENRIWVDLGSISTNLQHAFIAIEDQQFYTNTGFNLKRTVFAALNEVSYKLTGHYLRGNQQGASTITQQLVKNITSDTADSGTSGYLRKLRKIFRAMALTNRYSKNQILEAYLNTISLTGNIGGVEAGANRYFDKHAGDQENTDAGQQPLTIAQCASIAAITKNPTAYSPITNPEQHLKRRDNVIWYMWKMGYITQEQRDAAYAEPLTLAEKTVAEDAAKQSNNSYFTDTLINEVIQDLMTQKGWDKDTATNYFYTAGLRIYSTVVPSLQTEMEDVFNRGELWDPLTIENWQPTDKNGNIIMNADGTEPTPKSIRTQGAGVVINYKGELCGVVGGLFSKTADRTLNRAVDSVRQVGSTMKGVAVYPLAIEYDYANYSSTQVDSPYSDTQIDENGNVLKGWPSNYSQTYTNAPMTVYQAIRESINTIAVKYGALVGERDLYDFAVDTLEVSSLDETKDVALAPMCLGSMTYGMSPYELAGCYMMYGNGGEFYSLHSYTSVEDSKGNVVLEPDVNQVQAISQDTSYIMNRLLRNVMLSGGTGSGFGADTIDGMDVVGKTGTTNDTTDVWFVGLNPYYVGSFWYGYDESESMTGRYSHSHHPGIRAFKEIMTTELANETMYPHKDWPQPDEGTVVEKRFCTVSGKEAGPNCPSAVGYYKADTNLGVCVQHG